MNNDTNIYFKAEVYHTSELYVNNDLNEGCDPDTIQDNGIIETITDKSIHELRITLIDRFGNIEYFMDNRYETCYDSIENDILICNTISIYITKVIEENITFE